MPSGFFSNLALPATAVAPPMAERKLLRGDYFRAAHVEPAFALPEGRGLRRASGEPVVRAFITRLALAKLAGMAAFAFAACLAADPSTATPAEKRDAALAAAICAVAVGHYWFIASIRAQRSGWGGAFRLPLLEGGDGEEESLPRRVGKAAFAQELGTDQLRTTDWLATTTLLSLSFGLLTSEINPTADEDSVLKSVELLTFLTPWVTIIGVTGKSFMNDLRPDSDGRSQPGTNWCIGVGCFAAACGLFALISADVVLRVGGVSNKTSGDAELVAYVVLFGQLLQIGYPVVAVVEALWLRCIDIAEDEFPASVSIFKDFAYGCLDVSIKGGLGLFAGLRCFSA